MNVNVNTPPASISSDKDDYSERFTITISPELKAALFASAKGKDITPSQIVRKLIRDYLEELEKKSRGDKS